MTKSNILEYNAVGLMNLDGIVSGTVYGLRIIGEDNRPSYIEAIDSNGNAWHVIRTFNGNSRCHMYPGGSQDAEETRKKIGAYIEKYGSSLNN